MSQLSAADRTALLEKWRPVVVYDSRETYHADSPAVFTDITDNPAGNTLRRASGEIIAAGNPSGWEHRYAQLDLAVLCAGDKYANDVVEKPGDYLDATGSAYPADAIRMHQHPGLADKLCARIKQDGAITWLQYHFFYYYNDMLLDWHEGDWEMVQVGLDEHGEPQQLVCAQHRHCQKRSWHEVETTAIDGVDVPVVYPAIGSHATYFDDGAHWGALFNFVDHHDGGNAQSRLRPELIEIDETTPWIAWPGQWGGTKTKLTSSPVGPAHQGRKWTSPTAWAETGHGFHMTIAVEMPPETPPAPAAPSIEIVGVDAPQLRISTSAGPERPLAARVTLQPTTAGELPQTDLIPLRSGQTTYAITGDYSRWHSAHVSVVALDGGESATVGVDLNGA